MVAPSWALHSALFPFEPSIHTKKHFDNPTRMLILCAQREIYKDHKAGL